MTSVNKGRIVFYFYLSVLCVFSYGASAQNKTFMDNFRVKGLLNFQYVTEDNDDLGQNDDKRESSYASQARIQLGYDFTDNLDGYLDLRGFKINGDSGADDGTGQLLLNQEFLEVRQYWLRQKDLLGYSPLSLQVGRQRVSEPETLWWNRDFDSVLLRFDKTLSKGFVGVGENLVAYRTSGSDFEEDDKNRFRVFGEISQQYILNQYIDARFLYEYDHSEEEVVGQLIDAGDRDLADAKILWFGTRKWGRIIPPTNLISAFDYRADVMGVYGDETLYSTRSGPTSFLRQVSSVDEYDVFGWGVDLGLDVELDMKLSPVLNFGYAYGSGDADLSDGKDGGFRQTGLHGNSSRRYDELKAIRNYGEVLRPELSNIHIASAGVKLSVLAASTLNVDYHSYWLDDKKAPLRGVGISGTLNGNDRYIGQSLDVVFNSDVLKELNVPSKVFNKTNLKLIAGSFKSGEAYVPNDGEISHRFLAEIEMRF